MCIGKLCFFCEYRNNVVIAVYFSGEKMPNSPAVTSKRPREGGERLPLEFFLPFPSRVRARVRRFSFLAFTSSPVCRKRLWNSA